MQAGERTGVGAERGLENLQGARVRHERVIEAAVKLADDPELVQQVAELDRLLAKNALRERHRLVEQSARLGIAALMAPQVGELAEHEHSVRSAREVQR